MRREAAVAEILQVTNASGGDFALIIQTILDNALRLCEAAFGFVTSYDAERFHQIAQRRVPDELVDYFKAGMDQPQRGDAHWRLLAGEELIQNLDQKDEDAYLAGNPLRRAIVELGGARSSLVVALRKDSVLLGALTIYRKEVRPFSDKQVALLQNFAAQAVIAIENARLLTEQREALEQQTATADILRVISQSPTDVNPVLGAVARAALKFCGARDAQVALRRGDKWFVAAHEGPIEAVPGMRPLTRQTGPGRAMVDAKVVHIADLQSAEALSNSECGHLAQGWASARRWWRPCFGMVSRSGPLHCADPEAWCKPPNQIELLKSFAAQAVIAIENVRLFTELTESLEQQTATADIKTQNSQSPTDVGPVLAAVAKAAMKFCGASDALVSLREGDEWLIAAHEGPIAAPTGERRMLTRHTAPGRAMTDGEVVQITDLQSVEADEFPEAREIGAREGFRSALAAPLLRDDVSIGAISLRRREAGQFEPRQIELLKTFAAQAVIAIENVRLFTELRESLEQQTASAEILRVISESPTEVKPVLRAVVKAAVRFCGADDASLVLREGDHVHFADHEGPLPSSMGERHPMTDRTRTVVRVIEGGDTVHIPDLQEADRQDFAQAMDLNERYGIRAMLGAPMLREGTGVGCLLLRRAAPGPFTPRQIELLETFAAQAVIAIENVRLFTELRDRQSA